MLDAYFAAHVEDQKSMSEWGVFLNSAPAWEQSQQQDCVMLPVRNYMSLQLFALLVLSDL